MAKAKKQEKSIDQRLEEALVLYVKTPYKLPSNWCWVRFNSIADFGMGQTILSKQLKDNGVPVYSATEEDKIFGYIDTESNRIKLNTGDLVIPARGNSIGFVKYIEEKEACCTQTTMFCKLYNKEVSRFIYYYMKARKEDLFVYNGNAIPQITIGNISEKFAPLAPIEEQKRIVEIIEKQFTKLDEARDLIQKSLDSFADRKSAILHQAFTGELTQKWRELYERNTYNWTRKAIGDLFFHTTGKALKKGNTDGILCKYITTSNLYWGRFDFSEVREMYFTEKELEKCTVRKGDLLICNGGDVGRAAIWPYDHKICLQNHISKLRPKEQNLDIRFFFYYFMYLKVKGDIKGKGIGIASLSAKDLLSMQVMLPLLDEQEEIVRILDSIFEKEDKSKELLDMLDKIDEMKKSILARAFRGQLGTSNPTDEPATDLLRKILENNLNERER